MFTVEAYLLLQHRMNDQKAMVQCIYLNLRIFCECYKLIVQCWGIKRAYTSLKFHSSPTVYITLNVISDQITFFLYILHNNQADNVFHITSVSFDVSFHCVFVFTACASVLVMQIRTLL